MRRAFDAQQRVGVHAGRVIEGLNCDWGRKSALIEQRFPLRRLAVDLKKIGRQAESEKLMKSAGSSQLKRKSRKWNWVQPPTRFARFINGCGFVERRQPCRRGEDGQKQAAEEDRGDGLARADIGGESYTARVGL